MSGFKKFLLVGGGVTGTGGVGYLTGRLHGAQKLNTALQTYNEVENTSIANEFYNRGLMDKQGADTKSLLALGGILGLAGTGGYIGGRLHQKVRNQELVNKFNTVNPAENQDIAVAAYELGKSASLAGDVVHSFKAIPRYFRWKVINGRAVSEKRLLQSLRGTPQYDTKGGLVKELKFDHIIKRSAEKHKQAYVDTSMARGIIGTATGLAGGAVFVKSMSPNHKEKFNKVMEYASMNKEANIFTSMLKGFSKGRKAVSSVAEKADKAILEKLKNPEFTRNVYKSQPKPSGRVDTGLKPNPTITPKPGVKTQTSNEAMSEAFSYKPKKTSTPTVDESVAEFFKGKDMKRARWNERIRNFGTAAAGVGIGAAGVGAGYNLAKRPRTA